MGEVCSPRGSTVSRKIIWFLFNKIILYSWCFSKLPSKSMRAAVCARIDVPKTRERQTTAQHKIKGRVKLLYSRCFENCRATPLAYGYLLLLLSLSHRTHSIIIRSWCGIILKVQECHCTGSTYLKPYEENEKTSVFHPHSTWGSVVP